MVSVMGSKGRTRDAPKGAYIDVPTHPTQYTRPRILSGILGRWRLRSDLICLGSSVVEQQAENLKVVGSIPTLGIRHVRLGQ
jgi:hypothetical protein